MTARWAYISGSNKPLRRYGHSKLSKMAACRQLGFEVTGNSAIRSADPEKPYPRTKHEVYRITRCGDMAIRVSWGIWNPISERRGGRRGSAMVPFERAMVVSYRLSIVTAVLSVTIRPQFAIECLRRLNQQGVGDFGPKFRGVPLGADPSCWGCKERTSPANQ